MKKIAFILDHNLMLYRLPFFMQIAKSYEVSVFHSGKKITNDTLFKEITVSSKNIVGFEYKILPSLDEFDIVVCMQNLRMLNLWILTFSPFKTFKLIHWGIGVSSRNGLELKKSMVSRLRNLMAAFSSAQVLYSDFPLPMFSKSVRKKTFVANNTIYNPRPQDFSNDRKDAILFIGSLNKRKGLDVLVRIFQAIQEKDRKEIKLIIIGEGPCRNYLENFIAENNLENSILLLGEVSDSFIKENYFKNAFVCVSPKQAGLSVLESFSYGVPFITYKDAISGGEHLNIKNNFNGYLVSSQTELKSKLIMLIRDGNLASRLGANAYNYYIDKRQMSNMVSAFVDTFEFVTFR